MERIIFIDLNKFESHYCSDINKCISNMEYRLAHNDCINSDEFRLFLDSSKAVEIYYTIIGNKVYYDSDYYTFISYIKLQYELYKKCLFDKLNNQKYIIKEYNYPYGLIHSNEIHLYDGSYNNCSLDYNVHVIIYSDGSIDYIYDKNFKESSEKKHVIYHFNKDNKFNIVEHN